MPPNGKTSGEAGLQWRQLRNGVRVLLDPRPGLAAPLALGPTDPSARSSPRSGVDSGMNSGGRSVVTVQVWYGVGARDEPAAAAGVAHLVEHLMFRGTRARPVQFGYLLDALGSDSNAFTSYDTTAYVNTALGDRLEALLTLEADRLAGASFDPAAFERERSALLSELAGYENDPLYRLDQATMAAAFPGAAAGRPSGGTIATVQRLDRATAQAFYRRHYRPDRALVVISGDFDPQVAIAALERTFGQLPPGEKGSAPHSVLSPNSIARASRPARVELRPAGGAALWSAVYRLPIAAVAQPAAWEAFDRLLAGGQQSRLVRALRDRGLATEVASEVFLSQDPQTQGDFGQVTGESGGGWYRLWVTVAGDAQAPQRLQDIEQLVRAELARLGQEGPTAAEVAGAQAQVRTGRLRLARDRAEWGSQVAIDCLNFGRCDEAAVTAFWRSLFTLQPGHLQAIATSLAGGPAAIGQLIPSPSAPPASPSPPAIPPRRMAHNASELEGPPPPDLDRYLPPLPPAPPEASPRPAPHLLRLANGLQVILQVDRRSPWVSLASYTASAGRQADPIDQAGLGQVTALALGTAPATGPWAQELEQRGMALESRADREGALVRLSALASDLPAALDLLAERLQAARLDGATIAQAKAAAIAETQALQADPAYLARQSLQQWLYPPGHPFHRFATPAQLQAIAPRALATFYRRHYRPETTVLALVGDFDPATVAPAIAQRFGAWRGVGSAPVMAGPPGPLPPARSPARWHIVAPDTTQAITLLGQLGLARHDARYPAARLLEFALGGDTTASRLSLALRDQAGLTYRVQSQFQAGAQPGPLLVELQTDPAGVDRALAITEQVFDQARSPAASPWPDLARFQTALLARETLALAQPDEWAERLAMQRAWGVGLSELAAWPDSLRQVTPAQVQQAAHSLWAPGRWAIVTVGPPPSRP